MKKSSQKWWVVSVPAIPERVSVGLEALLLCRPHRHRPLPCKGSPPTSESDIGILQFADVA